ncbi:type II toxin-antitoxin system VapC family toxin [Belliella pelovolcani]|uniref:PIN domain-containing protein n=1 Tax=Belliella pelovolcani TaxID=529505 RepID=A0A1N7LBM2_9BACT|nr:PIN domain-containing protein [Belliella pelovolcani]SIS71265.1 PIN domain-containing protein [Belliella pelovolcani]
MKKIFLDTNVLLSFHFCDAEPIQQKAIDFIFQEIQDDKFKGIISIISFYQLLYFLEKKYASAKIASNRAYAYLELLEIGKFDPKKLEGVNYDYWPDYEDGLQYASALSCDAEVIITTNSKDFFSSKIEVIDPLNFILLGGI